MIAVVDTRYHMCSITLSPNCEHLISEAAELILKGLKGAIASKRVTYDFARLMDGATEIKCSQFGDNVIEHM